MMDCQKTKFNPFFSLFSEYLKMLCEKHPSLADRVISLDLYFTTKSCSGIYCWLISDDREDSTSLAKTFVQMC